MLNNFVRTSFVIIGALCAACKTQPNAVVPPLPTAFTYLGAYPVTESDSQAYPGPNLLTAITPEPPRLTEQPALGKAAVSGVLYSYTARMIVPTTQLYLTPATGEDQRQVPLVFIGPQVHLGDIQTQSNVKGQFFVTDIIPGNYYMAVWSPVGWSIAYQTEGSTEPLLIELVAETTPLDLGIVYLAWP